MADQTETDVEFFEMFFGDALATAGSVKAGDDGLIWKPMLPVGVWKIGPNGRPLKVINGRSTDQQKQIGMQDIIDSFTAGAVPHVTIPKTHDDAVDENTGFIRKLKVANHNGIATLFGGHEFTDKKIKSKVLDGSIANTSVGLEFNYTRKEDGKQFPIILRHNALTNRPWLGRKLAPFGLEEDDKINYTIMCGEYSEPLKDEWEVALTHDQVHNLIASAVNCEVVAVAVDRVLLKEDDKNFVALYFIEDGSVKLQDREQWVERAEVEHTDTKNDNPTSGSPDTIKTSEGIAPKTKEAPVAEEIDKKEPDPVTPPVVAKADLSEDPMFLAEQEKNARLSAQLDQLLTKDRTREADDLVKSLKEMGLDETHGCTEFLKYVRTIMMQDKGETAILLSEEDGGTAQSMTVAGIVRNLLDKLPLGDDGKLKVVLSEQATDPLGTTNNLKPPAKDLPKGEGEDLSLEDRQAIADAFFDEHMSAGHKKPTTKTKES